MYKLHKNDRATRMEKRENEFFDRITNIIDENQKAMKLASEEADTQIKREIGEVIDELGILRDGVLSVQGRQFKTECRQLLQEGHVITLQEYELTCEEHRIYHTLGGNHDGDKLFELVTIKYQEQLKK